MKRIALLLAAAISSAGCVVTTDPTGSVTVEWDDGFGTGNFVAYNGASGLNCGSGYFTGLSDDGFGISYVDVYVDTDTVPYSAFCDDGFLVVDGLSTGFHDIVVEGTDNTGYVIARDWASIEVFDGSDSLFTSTPGETYVQVDYGFYGGGSCLATNVGDYIGSDYISFDLRDDISGQTVTYNRNYTCGSTISLRVPWSWWSVTWAGEEQYNDFTGVYDVLRDTSGTNGFASVSTEAWDPVSYPVPVTVDLDY